MYTLEQLQNKRLTELKEIGWKLNVLPEGDRRCRQSWIDAIAGVNPPLLQLLEVSPAGEVPAEEPIIETVETSPGVEVEQAQDAIVQGGPYSPGVDVEYIQMQLQEPLAQSSPGACDCPSCGAIHALFTTKDHLERTMVRCLHCNYGRPKHYLGAIRTLAQEAIIETIEITPLREENGFRECLNGEEGFITDGWGDIVECPRCDGSQWVKIEDVEPQAQEPTRETVETSPGVEVDRALSHKFLLCLKEGHNALWYDGKNFVCEKWSAKTYCKRGVGSAKHQLRCHPEVKRLGNLQVVENSPADQNPIKVQATEPIEPAAKTSPGAEVDRVQHPIIEMVETFPAAEVEQAQEAIAPAAKNLPGSRLKTTAHQLLELFKSSAHIIKDSPAVKTEATVSESAIAPAVKNYPDEESDQNPILTAIPLSEKFVTRYTPPQSEIIHFQSDADGQLSLLDFEVESVNEPPDPDDFESLDAFRKAIARWDREHPTSSFDHCSDLLPSSVHCELNSVHCELPNPDDFDSMFAFWAAYDAWDEATDDDPKPLEISLDSFCEWAPCPANWYEPVALDCSSKVLELSSVRKSSITSDFFIPTFDAWCDRLNRDDEPPDTGIFARLPKPKPPKFPPQSASWTQVGHKLDASWTQVSEVSRSYPETIPKLFHRVAGTSNQPARSPPGGDATMF